MQRRRGRSRSRLGGGELLRLQRNDAGRNGEELERKDDDRRADPSAKRHSASG